MFQCAIIHLRNQQYSLSTFRIQDASAMVSDSAWLEGPLAEVSDEGLRHGINTMVKPPSTTTAPVKERDSGDLYANPLSLTSSSK